MIRFALFLLAASLVLTASAAAAELVMYRSPGCPYCKAWDRSIAPIYPKTDIGRKLPLRQIEIGRRSDGPVALKSPVRFTPTFVLADKGRELGRIEGYAGEDFFWGLLERLLLQHGI